jgi:hypothetical protein
LLHQRCFRWAPSRKVAALVSPPRFELFAKPGERLREVLEITTPAAGGKMSAENRGLDARRRLGRQVRRRVDAG